MPKNAIIFSYPNKENLIVWSGISVKSWPSRYLTPSSVWKNDTFFLVMKIEISSKNSAIPKWSCSLYLNKGTKIIWKKSRKMTSLKNSILKRVHQDQQIVEKHKKSIWYFLPSTQNGVKKSSGEMSTERILWK